MAQSGAPQREAKGRVCKVFAPELEATCRTQLSDPNTKLCGRRRALLPRIFQLKIRWFSRARKPAR